MFTGLIAVVIWTSSILLYNDVSGINVAEPIGRQCEVEE